MKRVAITGATSMIGAALVQECIENDVEVLAIVREKSSKLNRLPKSNLVRIYECNLDDLNSIEANKQYDVFYHFAWQHTGKENRDDPVLQEQNIRYTLDAVKLAKKLGCTKFIGAGSQAEYGRVDGVITPDTPINPFIAYGMSKYAAGVLSKKLCNQYSIVHTWARIFSVYGKYDSPESMISYAIGQFSKGRHANFSAATQLWDFMHECDAGKVFYELGQSEIKKDKIYCVASGDCRSLREFILEISECFDNASLTFDEPQNTEKLLNLQPDISALAKDIGYVQQMRFRDGIRDIIAYKRKMENDN